MKKLITISTIAIIAFVSSCSNDSIFENENPFDDVDQYLTYIESTPQRVGDVNLGEAYLKEGDYVNSGIPADLFRLVFPDGDNLLGRNGKNLDIPFDYSQVTHPNGVEIVSPNCMQCHGGFVDGQFHIGVANLDADFTVNNGLIGSLVDLQIKNMYGEGSAEGQAYHSFNRAIMATGSHLLTETVGANSADKLAVVLGAHRDKNTLEWLDNPQYDIPSEVIPSDVPAWWLLKKKNAMFSTGIGQGDFARIMMASSVLTLTDTTDASIIDTEFINVASYIKSLEPPQYPNEIDKEKSERGKILFEGTCTKCHGTYGGNETYPNVLVAHKLLQTDQSLAMSNYAYKEFADWYNASWFSKGDYGGGIVETEGYLAPPLDGIWATAPYLHNGSIPNLASLLDSSLRVDRWRRSPNDSSYDFVSLGIVHTAELEKSDKFIFDTSLTGYSNAGHYFADFMTDTERQDLLEYLKTL